MTFAMTGMARAFVTGAVVAVTATASWLFMSSDHSTAKARPKPGLGLPTALEQEAITVAPAAEPAPRTPTAAAPQVVLTGVVVGANGGANLAIVSVDLRPEMLMRVGDPLGIAGTVVRIDDASMTYRLAGKELSVFVKASPKVTVTATPDAAPKQYPGFVAAAPAMARALGSEPGSGNEAFRQAVEKKFQAIASGR